jgi:hypothetical protein
MSCVLSETYTFENGNDKYKLKAFGIDDKFTFEITRNNPFHNHSYGELMSITKTQAKVLIKQLNQFIAE